MAQKDHFFDTFLEKSHRSLIQPILAISVSFEQFVWTFKFFDPKSALLTTFFLSRCQQKGRSGGRFWRVLVAPNKLLKMHHLGQNEPNKRFKHTRAPISAQKCLFEAPLKNGQNWQGTPFEAQNGVFARSAPPPCAVRLSWKLIWELFRARQSPHAIFSSNGQHTAEVEPSKNRKNRLFRKMGQNRHFAKKCQKVAIFWPKTKNFAQIS